MSRPGAPSGAPRGDLVLADARLASGARADVLVEDGLVAGPVLRGTGRVLAPGIPVVDLDGALLLPAFTEPHGHVDKALVGSLGAGPGLRGALDAWSRDRSRRDVAETRDRARTALLEYIRHGTGTVRTHVDVDERLGPDIVSVLAGLRAELAGLVRLEIVAMPATPLTGTAGPATRARLVEALAAGADLVGGAPWVEDDARTATGVLLDVAAEHGVGVDLHVDESLSTVRSSVGSLVAAVDAGFGSEVTISHLVGLGQAPEGVQRAVAADLARTGIAVVTNPRSNLWLQDREQRTGARRGLTAVRTLLDAGVPVRAGGDNLRDPFNPYGSADPLAVAQLLALCAEVSAGEALAAVTAGAVGADRLLPVPGQPADLVAIPATGPDDAVARTPGERLVVHGGRLVARRRVVDELLPQP